MIKVQEYRKSLSESVLAKQSQLEAVGYKKYLEDIKKQGQP